MITMDKNQTNLTHQYHRNYSKIDMMLQLSWVGFLCKLKNNRTQAILMLLIENQSSTSNLKNSI